MFESEKKQPKKIKIPTKISLPRKQTWNVNIHSHSCSWKELQKLDLVMTRIQIQMGQNSFVIVLQNTCNCLSRRIGWYQGCLSFDLFLGCAWHFPSCRAFEWSVYQSPKCWWEIFKTTSMWADQTYCKLSMWKQAKADPWLSFSKSQSFCSDETGSLGFSLGCFS